MGQSGLRAEGRGGAVCQTNREGGVPELVTTHQPPLWTWSTTGETTQWETSETDGETALFKQGGVLLSPFSRLKSQQNNPFLFASVGKALTESIHGRTDRQTPIFTSSSSQKNLCLCPLYFLPLLLRPGKPCSKWMSLHTSSQTQALTE